MAVTLKRKRDAVSYREPSSDEDLSDSDQEQLPRRVRSAPVRRSARHQSAEAEQQSPQRRRAVSPIPIARTRAANPRNGLRRRGKRQISYQDVSSEDDGDEDFEEEDTVVEQRPRRTLSSPRLHKGKQSGRRPGRPPSKITRKPLGAPLKPKIGRTFSSFRERPSDLQQYHLQCRLWQTSLPMATDRHGLRYPTMCFFKSSYTPRIRYTTRTWCRLLPSVG